MQKYYSFFLFVFFFNLTQSIASSKQDSIGIESANGKKIILHKVLSNDTYYSIGRRYNVSSKVIITYNDNKFLKINVIIKVPTEIPFNSTTPQNTLASGTSVAVPSSAEEGIVEHVVIKRDNLNMLAQKYGTTVNQIKDLNNLNSVNLRIGQVLKIPVQQRPESELTATTPVPVAVDTSIANQTSLPSNSGKPIPTQTSIPTKNSIPDNNTSQSKSVVTGNIDSSGNTEKLVEHTVASNETIYSIATRYKLTMDQLQAKNNISGNSLYVGQKLLIKGQYGVKPPFSNPVTGPGTDSSTMKDPLLKYPPSKYGLNQVDEKGTAVWITDQDLDPTKMLVLHRSAPVGTVMKITNPMSNRSTFAKVVGKFTENESTKDVIIVLNKAVADALGALDKRFFCNLTYSGQQDNEQ